MALIRIDPPSAEPITLAAAKSHLDVDYDDHNAMITGFIKAARAKLEKRCARAFMEQVWELQTDTFEDQIELPLPPCLSVDRISYLDSEGELQTIDRTGNWDVVEGGEHAAMVIPLTDWPTDIYERPDAVRVRFTAGWEDAASVPDELKQAILWLVGHMYENRESVILTPTRQEFQEVPDSVVSIIAPYIVPRL